MMMQLLQQRGFNPAANPGAGKAANPFDDPAMVGVILVGVCFGLLIWGLIYGSFIFVLVRAMKALQEVRPRNQAVAPGLVWLGLIPVFGSFWTLYVTSKTAESLADELDDRRLRTRADDVKSTGTIYGVVVAICCVLFFAGAVPLIGALFGCVNLILIIVQVVFAFMYAGKLQVVTKKLQRDGDRGGRDDRDDGDDFEEYDDEPKPKPKKKPKLDDGFEEYDEPKGGR